MHDKLKTYFTRYSGTVYILLAVLIIICGWFIFGGGNDSDNSRPIDHLERAKEQQRNGLEINKTVTDSVERSTQLNQRASERIVRAQEYQQRASERVKEGTRRLDEAEHLLERNAELIRDVEQRHQEEQGDGTTATPPTQHMGAD